MFTLHQRNSINHVRYSSLDNSSDWNHLYVATAYTQTQNQGNVLYYSQ